MLGNRALHSIHRTSSSLPAMPARTFELGALPDAALMACLAADGRRPNVLVECAGATSDNALQLMLSLCARPVRHCALPGKLELPATKEGSLIIRDAAALSPAQQVQLYDWLSVGCSNVQVISLTTLPLRELVEDGAFLEGLYYRLNVIRVNTVPLASLTPRSSLKA